MARTKKRETTEWKFERKVGWRRKTDYGRGVVHFSNGTNARMGNEAHPLGVKQGQRAIPSGDFSS